MRFTIVAVLSIGMSISCAVPPAAFAAHGYYLQTSIGKSGQKAIPAIYPKLPAAAVYSGELGMFITDYAALGIRLSFNNNDASGNQIVWQDLRIHRWKVDTNVYEATARAGMWIPRQTGLILGGGAGISHFNSDTGLSSARRSATAPVFEFFSGFQHTFTNEFMLFCRFGYAYRDFGMVAAKLGRTSSDPLDLDMSGWFVEVGLGGHTRRGWGSAE